MSLLEVLSPFFAKLQFWHLMVGRGLLFFLTGWQLEKKKLDRENADLIAYDKAMKELEKETKQKGERK